MIPARSIVAAGPRRRRGLTLLELLVALAITVAAMTLVAALWAQMRDWAADNGRLGDALRPRRVAAFLRDQWDGRRSIVPVDEAKQGSVTVDQDALRFVTATPALFPDAPLVMATWTIERTPDLRAPEWWSSRLVYEEARVTNMQGVSPDRLDSVGEIARKRIVALDGCRDLRWEVWSGGASSSASDGGDAPALSRLWRRVDGPTLVALAATPPAGSGAKSDDASAPGSSGGAAGAPSTRASLPASGVDGRQEAPPTLRAVRLAGVAGSEEFSWSFVVEASR